MKAKLINENFTENYVINLLKSYGIKDIENYRNERWCFVHLCKSLS